MVVTAESAPVPRAMPTAASARLGSVSGQGGAASPKSYPWGPGSQLPGSALCLRQVRGHRVKARLGSSFVVLASPSGQVLGGLVSRPPFPARSILD